MKQSIFRLIIFLFLLSGFTVTTGAHAQTIDIRSKGEKYDKYWERCIGAGRANEGLRAGWLEQLELVHKDCGFQYVRFHGLFHDDMFVYFPKNNGKTIYNWQYIDELFDRMLNMGIRPFVELAFFPKEMAATDTKHQFWWKANISVDQNNFGKWHDLVQAFTQHVVDRYGIQEVSSWYFEVWNEPNLNPGFLDGTKSDYFHLYKEAALAVKSVDQSLRVGGPSTSNFVADSRFNGEVYDKNKSVFWDAKTINTKEWKGVWIEDFLAYCVKENLPVDFISTHPYPTDYALDPETGRGRGSTRYVHSTRDDIEWLRKILSKSKYPNAEIHLTEWSTSPNSRDVMHDMLPPAAYIIKANLDCIGLCNSLSYWTFTDIFEEKGGGETIFHGGFGLINFQGIVKPSFHAYRMLHRLGSEKLYYEDPLFVSRNPETGKINVLAFNYPKEYEQKVPGAEDAGKYMDASSKTVNFTLTGLDPNTIFEVETLDNNHGNAINIYREMGSPHSPTREETALLKERASSTDKEFLKPDNSGILQVSLELTPWTCILISQK